jgi:hypothetical protein
LRGPTTADPNTLKAGSATHATVPEASVSSSLSTSTAAAGKAAVTADRTIATAQIDQARAAGFRSTTQLLAGNYQHVSSSQVPPSQLPAQHHLFSMQVLQFG